MDIPLSELGSSDSERICLQVRVEKTKLGTFADLNLGASVGINLVGEVFTYVST
jgi:hypothetical protein